MAFANFTIPVPPSLNNIFFNRPGGGRAKTKAYTAWITEAVLGMRAARQPDLRGDVRVDLIIRRPNASSDLDNRIKGALDALQKAGVLANDNQVVGISARWGTANGCEIIVSEV